MMERLQHMDVAHRRGGRPGINYAQGSWTIVETAVEARAGFRDRPSRCLTTAAIGVILLNPGAGLSVLAERSRQLRRHEGFGGEALDAVRQGSAVDFFAIFVGHPNEAPEKSHGRFCCVPA